jgi:dUTP pyrophosphatase
MNEQNIEIVDIKIELCREGAVFPRYANPYDAGMDIYAAEDCLIKPGETVPVPTGLKLAIPPGYEVQIRPRSGISLKTLLRIPNSPATIDSGYRGEVMVIMHNLATGSPDKVYTLKDEGNPQGSYLIKKGDRIAQMVLSKVPRIRWEQVDDVKRFGTDRGGGFGSSGV